METGNSLNLSGVVIDNYLACEIKDGGLLDTPAPVQHSEEGDRGARWARHL